MLSVIVFPAPFLFTLHPVCMVRRPVSKAHMLALCIIDTNNLTDPFSGTDDFLEVFLVEPFHLEYSVHAFGGGILKWVSALSHTDEDAVVPQLLHIGVTAVLASSVGMVDEPFQGTSCVAHCHSQRTQGVPGLESWTDAPFHYPLGIEIRDKMQIYEALGSGAYICDVAYPYLIGCRRDNIPDEVRPLSHPSAAECRSRSSSSPDLKPVPVSVHQVEKRVTADSEAFR